VLTFNTLKRFFLSSSFHITGMVTFEWEDEAGAKSVRGFGRCVRNHLNSFDVNFLVTRSAAMPAGPVGKPYLPKQFRVTIDTGEGAVWFASGSHLTSNGSEAGETWLSSRLQRLSARTESCGLPSAKILLDAPLLWDWDEVVSGIALTFERLHGGRWVEISVKPVEPGQSRNGLNEIVMDLHATITSMNGVFQTPLLVQLDDGERCETRIGSTDSAGTGLSGANVCLQLFNESRKQEYCAKLFGYLRNRRANNGDPNLLETFETIALASSAQSGWLALVLLSSAIEGLCKLHPAWTVRAAKFTPDELTQAKTIVRGVTCRELKSALQSRLGQLGTPHPTPKDILSLLHSKGLLEGRHVAQWTKLRNAGSHGDLSMLADSEYLSPQIPVLLDIFYSLVGELIEFSGTRREFHH
jgi:hypothetical protein